MLTPPKDVEQIFNPLLCQAPDDALIEIMTNELAELEKRPVNGWDVQCPMLYKTIFSMVEDLCSRAHCPMPNLFIDLTGINIHQASAYLMIDGTTQLHLGVEFLKTFLLTKSSADRAPMYRAFRWTLAHELGHLCDPAFKMFGRSYNVRNFLDRFLAGLFFLGMLGLIPGAHLVLGAINSGLILAVCMTLMVLQKVVFALLSRRFEYFADAKSAGIIDDLDSKDMERALTIMALATRNAVANPFEQAPDWASRFFGSCIKKFVLAKLSLGHPAISRRVRRLQKSL